jgi:hypothetical protein
MIPCLADSEGKTRMLPLRVDSTLPGRKPIARLLQWEEWAAEQARLHPTMTVADEVPWATKETVPIHHHTGMDRLHHMDEAAADTVLQEVKRLSEEMDLQGVIGLEVTALLEVVRGTSFGNEDHLEVVLVVATVAGTTIAIMTESVDDQEVRNVVEETTVDDDIEVDCGFSIS